MHGPACTLVKHLNMAALPAGMSASMLSWSCGRSRWRSVSGSLQLHLQVQTHSAPGLTPYAGPLLVCLTFSRAHPVSPA